MIINIMLIVILLYESMWDIRTKQIKLVPLAVAAVAGGLLNYFWYEKDIIWIMCGVITGSIFLLVGKATRQ